MKILETAVDTNFSGEVCMGKLVHHLSIQTLYIHILSHSQFLFIIHLILPQSFPVNFVPLSDPDKVGSDPDQQFGDDALDILFALIPTSPTPSSTVAGYITGLVFFGICCSSETNKNWVSFVQGVPKKFPLSSFLSIWAWDGCF